MLSASDPGPLKAVPVKSVCVPASFRNKSGIVELELWTFLIQGSSAVYRCCRAKPQEDLSVKKVQQVVKDYCDKKFGSGNWLHLPDNINPDAHTRWEWPNGSIVDSSLLATQPADSIVPTSNNTSSLSRGETYGGRCRSKKSRNKSTRAGSTRHNTTDSNQAENDESRSTVLPDTDNRHPKERNTGSQRWEAAGGDSQAASAPVTCRNQGIETVGEEQAGGDCHNSQRVASFIENTFNKTWEGLQKLESLGIQNIHTAGPKLVEYREGRQTEAELQTLISHLPKVSRDLERRGWLVDMITHDVRYWGRMHFESGSRTKSEDRQDRKNQQWGIFIRMVTDRLAPNWGQACACLLYNAFEAVEYKASELTKLSEKAREKCVDTLVSKFRSCGRTIQIPEEAWVLHPLFFLTCVMKKELPYVCGKIGLDNLSTLDIQENIRDFDLETHGIYVGIKFSDLWKRQADGHTASMTVADGIATIKFASKTDQGGQVSIDKRLSAEELPSSKRHKPYHQETGSCGSRGRPTSGTLPKDIPAGAAIEQHQTDPQAATTEGSNEHFKTTSDRSSIQNNSTNDHPRLFAESIPDQALQQVTGLGYDAQMLESNIGGPMAIPAAAADAIGEMRAEPSIDPQGDIFGHIQPFPGDVDRSTQSTLESHWSGVDSIFDFQFPPDSDMVGSGFAISYG